jgi:hypothetical protein
MSVADGVEEADQTTGVPNRLLVPDHLLTLATARVYFFVGILLRAEFFVGVVDRENEEQSGGRTRDEGEKIWVVDAEDVVELEFGAQTQLVDEAAHHLWVVL